MKMNDKRYDVIIVGGGVMGCACAYYLKKLDPGVKVAVIEKDPSYTFASSSLSMANVRIQFSLKENIEISLYAFDFLERFAEEMEVDGDRPDPGFCREGNLFLVDENGHQPALEAMELQKSLGCRVDWWAPEEIQKHLESWDYSKIGKVEKAILRLGAYEILVEGTDRPIIINEAVELAKELADEKSPQFINGVLDAVGKPTASSEE